ncbi:tetratricopeptide repeat protein [bacterium]|nr:tetratricopeptide repeat protein [bacterium]
MVFLRSSVPRFSSYSAFFGWVRTWRTLPVYSWIRAAEHYRKGQFPEAIRLYRNGLRKHPNHPARHCVTVDLARCLFAEGEMEEAEQCLRRLVAKIPGSRTAHRTLFLFQQRAGQSLDAAWTLRRAFREIAADPEMIGLYLFCVVENGGPQFLLDEAMRLVGRAEQDGEKTPLMEAAVLRHELESKGYANDTLKKLELVSDAHPESVEIALLAGEALLRAGKIASTRRVLRRALPLDSSHPRILSLLAETYLRAGSFYNPTFAEQLATEGCKRTAWRSPREMHVLAEVFFHLQDPLSALVTAERAQEEGNRLLGTYRDSAALRRLIEQLHEDLEKISPIAA